MKEIIKHTLRKVTLELVYQVVDERTTELISEIKEVKKRQEDDFRYLTQKIEELKKKQEDDFRYIVQKIDSEVGGVRTEIGAINQRIDTVIQMLVTLRQDQK